MYKILLKYKSFTNKTYWQSYETILENGTSVEFSTDNLEKLKAELDKLDKKYGYDNIRIIDDITYDVVFNVNSTNVENIEVVTSEDVNSVYTTAYNNVFNGNGGV